MAKNKQTKQDIKQKDVEETKDVLKAPEGDETTQVTQDTGETKQATPEAQKAEDDIVYDGKGRALYRVLKPTVVEQAKPKEMKKVSYKKPTRANTQRVSANPALLPFPADRWGVSRDIRRAMISTSSRIAGDTNKYELVKEVLEILIKHMEAKYEADRAYKEKLNAQVVEKETQKDTKKETK